MNFTTDTEFTPAPFEQPKATLSLDRLSHSLYQITGGLQAKITSEGRQTIKHIVLVSGISGSGKTTAIRFLEDIGYYCVDNLPVNLIYQLLSEIQQQNAVFQTLKQQQSYFSTYDELKDSTPSSKIINLKPIQTHKEYIAIGIDIRTNSLEQLPEMIAHIKQSFEIDCLFLDASNDILLKRFAQTRRKHPISESFFKEEKEVFGNRSSSLEHSLSELERCLIKERESLAYLQEIAYKIDTSHLQSHELKSRLQAWLASKMEQAHAKHVLITVQSFGFKYGLPNDCDFVFDARHLPNPYYDESLRLLTGLDTAVIDFLEQSPAVHFYLEGIIKFIAAHLENLVKSDRAYLTIGIGCTGGQHRSVYLAENISQAIQKICLERRLAAHLQTVHRCIEWHHQKS